MENKPSISPVHKTHRKIRAIKPSKYEIAENINKNKSYWKKEFADLHQSNTTTEKESQKLSEVLPEELYKKVCNTLDIPILYSKLSHEHSENIDQLDDKQRKIVKAPLLSKRKTLTIERELDSDTDVEVSPREDINLETSNIHLDLLQRPVREQITWPTRYLQPERDDEKTLVRRADDITDKIAQEFCEYMKQLGGDQPSHLFTPKVIKELFQVEFDTHVTHSLKIIPKELPTVSEKVTNVTGNPELSQHSALEREITRDIKAEKSADYLTAFNRSVPGQEQWRAPRNYTRNLWRSSKYVPRDLVTLKTVWEGITNLGSVKEYCRWMIEHPEYRRAPYLCSLGLFDSAVLDARLTFESKHDLSPPPYKTSISTPEPIEHNIQRRLSEFTEI